MAQRLEEMTVGEFLDADASGEIGVKVRSVDEARARILREASGLQVQMVDPAPRLGFNRVLEGEGP